MGMGNLLEAAEAAVNDRVAVVEKVIEDDKDRVRQLSRLRKPFPTEAISSLPRGNTTLSYVGHANVTDRLLSIDPFWNWEPTAWADDGLPRMTLNEAGQPVGLWINLTVAGQTRLGYGSCAGGKQDPVKELIGDAIRNAAMRFGVALDLWCKDELESESQKPNVPGLVTAFKRHGVTVTQLEKYLGHAIADVTPEQYASLVALGLEIGAGKKKAAEIFPAAKIDMGQVGVGTPPANPRAEVGTSPQPTKRAKQQGETT